VAKPLTCKRWAKQKLENTLQFTNNENDKRMQARDSLGLLTMIWKARRERGFCTKAFGCFLELLVAKIGQHLSTNL
jgi:hypothetical protein